jgi:hypothetical protein
MVTLRQIHSTHPDGLQLRWNESSGFSVKTGELSLLDLTSHFEESRLGAAVIGPPATHQGPRFSNQASSHEVFPLTQ